MSLSKPLVYWSIIEQDPPPKDAIVITRDAFGLVIRGRVYYDMDGAYCKCPISDYVLDDVVYWMFDPPVPEDA